MPDVGRSSSSEPSSTALGLDEIHLRWFQHWLNGQDTGLLDAPSVKFFVMGDDVWRDENEWPLARCPGHQLLPAQRRQRQRPRPGRLGPDPVAAVQALAGGRRPAWEGCYKLEAGRSWRSPTSLVAWASSSSTRC